ncbi:MAG: hypothetical protein RIS47_109 [Bacteroidota bacterium]
MDLENLPALAKKNEKNVKAAFDRIRRKKPKDLDDLVFSLHEEAFGQIDCLECANCCRSLGPRLTDKDIERLAKRERLKPSDWVLRYARVDEDGDYVFREMPCPFLAADNYCVVYEDRPKACREYPHTDRRKFVQLLNLTLANRATCPAVLQIADKLSEKF